MIVYHVTYTRNVPSILVEGLKGSYRKVGGGLPSIFKGGEDIVDPEVYFFRSLKDVEFHLGYSTFLPGPWSLLRVRLPKGWNLGTRDEYDGAWSGDLALISVFSVEEIPPKYIEVLHSGGSIGWERGFFSVEEKLPWMDSND